MHCQQIFLQPIFYKTEHLFVWKKKKIEMPLHTYLLHTTFDIWVPCIQTLFLHIKENVLRTLKLQ